MFKKMKLKSEIKGYEKLIVDLEAKRARSQAALVTAILEAKDPNEKDVEFFNAYTQQIEEARSRMIEKQNELKSL